MNRRELFGLAVALPLVSSAAISTPKTALYSGEVFGVYDIRTDEIQPISISQARKCIEISSRSGYGSGLYVKRNGSWQQYSPKP